MLLTQSPAAVTVVDTEKIYDLVEDPPLFSGCKDWQGEKFDQRGCSQEQLRAYLEQKMKYPREALKNKAEGTAIVKFVVEKDGSVSSATLLNDPGSGLGDEAIRLVLAMPAWEPARHRQMKVRCLYTLPIEFDYWEFRQFEKERKKVKTQKKRRTSARSPEREMEGIVVLLAHNPSRNQPGIIEIKYALKSDSEIHLQILDTAGQPLRTLVQAAKPKGSHLFEFSPAAFFLPPGEYAYSLTTEQGILTRPIRW
jgi:TonB family protein